MPTTVTMPQLGETVTEGTVAQWLKRPGDNVEKYEPFVEVSTDKVNAEVPAPVSGVLRELLVKEGETVATGTAIAVIEEVTAAATSPSKAEANRMASDEPVPGQTNAPASAPAPSAPLAAPAPPPASGAQRTNGKADVAALRSASPAVRRLAREHNVDIRAVRGTGAGGRVTAEDVINASAGAPASAATPAAAPETHALAPETPALAPEPASDVAAATSAPPAPVAAPSAPVAAPSAPAAPAPAAGTSTYDQPVPGTTIPLNQARKIIAQRMLESKQTAPHAWSMVEVDVTNLWKWRDREKSRFEQETGHKLTLLPFFIRAVVQSLQKFPLVNARFASDGIQVLKEINIGIAIGLPANLVVPVVRAADRLTIKALGIAAGELVGKARKGKLGVDDLAGGTFTVNNNGANGSILSAPIINGGQAGILTMEAVVKRPVIVESDAIAIRRMMNVCLSLDHRVLDGYTASGFLADLKRRLESMGPDGTI